MWELCRQLADENQARLVVNADLQEALFMAFEEALEHPTALGLPELQDLEFEPLESPYPGVYHVAIQEPLSNNPMGLTVHVMDGAMAFVEYDGDRRLLFMTDQGTSYLWPASPG